MYRSLVLLELAVVGKCRKIFERKISQPLNSD